MAHPPPDNQRDHTPGAGGHGGASSRWLISYADFITLMMVVFMVLYAMARVDNDKYSKLRTSLANSNIGAPITPLPAGGNPMNAAPVLPGPDPQSAPGHLYPIDLSTAMPAPPLPSAVAPAEEPAVEPAAPPPAVPVKPTAAPPPDPLGQVRDGFQNLPAARAGSLSVQLQDRGLVVSILTSLLFEEGKADLKPGASALLDQIRAELEATRDSVLVEGAPDSGTVDSPWDLASRRAGAVVRYLVETHGLRPDRFTVIGYGKGAGTDGIVNVVVLRRP